MSIAAKQKKKITPENAKWHKELEYGINKRLSYSNFYIGCISYHEVLSRDLQEVLRFNNSLTALAIRAQADRFAIHKKKSNITFEYELKTHENFKYDDLTLELIPLFKHIGKNVSNGVDCLYVYWNPLEENSLPKGFWADLNGLPKVEICFSTKRYEYLEDWFKNQCAKYFPEAKFKIIEGTESGSNDPFLIIKKNEVDKMKSWRECILEKFEINNWEDLKN